MANESYLGDGVYASTDGGMILLHVGSHDSPPVVALEPEVFDALVQYASRVTPPGSTEP